MEKVTTPKICIIGAGFGGLTVGIQLRRLLKWSSFTIYDKNADIGGAWFSNTYPGAECDVQSHLYSWSFEPNTNWARNYASQAEILRYIKDVAEKYVLYENFKPNTEVESATWDEAACKWRLISNNLVTGLREERDYDFVFCGANFLWQPNKPKEFEAFAGPCVHTAEWDHTLNLEGKVVGVVGSGASAIQSIPQIAPKVKVLHSFQRNPNWVFPKRAFEYSALTKCLFKYVPFAMKFYRWKLFWELDGIAEALVPGSKTANNVTALVTKSIEEQAKDNPVALKQLVPDSPFGCRIVTFSSSYFSTMASDKVQIHTSKIVEVKPHSLVTEDGTETQLDALILGTGFKSQEIFGPMKIIGLQKQNVLEVWKNDRPKNYLGIFTTLAPNLFFIGGPYGICVTAAAIFNYEIEATVAVKLLGEMFQSKKRRILVKESAQNDFMKKLDDTLSNHVQNLPGCQSWIKNAKGEVTSIAPFTAYRYWRESKSVDLSKFIIE